MIAKNQEALNGNQRGQYNIRISDQLYISEAFES